MHSVRKRYRKLILLTLVAIVAALPATAFAHGRPVPEGAGVAPMVVSDSNADADTPGDIVTPQGTVYGPAGYSWINTSRISYLRAQAAFGAHSYVGSMQFISWVVSWGDGKTSSGTDIPFSSTWTGQALHNYSSSGWYTTMLSGYALAGTQVLTILNPVDLVYIY